MKLTTLPKQNQLSILLIAVTTSVILNGCSTSSRKTQQPLTDTAKNALIKNWQLRGKIGLQQNKKGSSAYINWQQCNDRFDIRLTGPLGQGVVHITGNQQETTLTRSDKTSITANSAEELLASEFGWPIPVSQLFYWIRGIPEPTTSFIPLTENTGFTQSDWKINYSKPQNIDGYDLPGKAIAKQSSLKITLLLKQWNLNPLCEPS